MLLLRSLQVTRLTLKKYYFKVKQDKPTVRPTNGQIFCLNESKNTFASKKHDKPTNRYFIIYIWLDASQNDISKAWPADVWTDHLLEMSELTYNNGPQTLKQSHDKHLINDFRLNIVIDWLVIIRSWINLIFIHFSSQLFITK